MKIGIFDPYLDTMGGGEKYMLTAALCLAKKNDVAIFWDQQEEMIKGLAKHRFGFDLSSIHFEKNVFANNVSLLERLLKTRLYDVVIYLSDGSIPFTLAKKLVIHFQFPVEWINAQSFKTGFKMRRVHTIICNSLFTKSYIDKKFARKSIVVNPPVTIEKAIDTKKENTIMHVSRFTGIGDEESNFKKQDVLISAFRGMVEEGLRGWRLILVLGIRESDKQKLEIFKNQTLGLPVDIIENPKRDDLWELYGRAKMYWHATGFAEDLVRHPERAEHFGITTVEAMASGCVPVVFNAGGQREIVKDGINGMLWETLEELKRKTAMLIENDSLWERLSNNAKDVSKRYSKERFCKELYEIIET